MPTRVEVLCGKTVQQIVGGEHHSIALTAAGEVYAFGKNDEGQIGVGDTYSTYRKERARIELEHQERLQRMRAEAEAQF